MTSIFEAEMDAQALQRFVDHAYRHTKIKITPQKKSMIQGRVRSRAAKLGIHSYQAYLDLLESNPNEVQEFINAVTTNETSFYRTPRVWEYFANVFLPHWFAERPTETLRVWSAAASSGEEPYTIAMLCKEFERSRPSFRFHITGTDISTAVLAKAQQGHFSGRSIESIKARHPELLKKYFRQNDDGHSINDELKSVIKFATHNLFEPMRIAHRFDIIFLRNVLIYFDAADQEKVLEHASRAILPGGTLILGESESLNGLKTRFKFVEPLVYQAQQP